jgi:hypothetical protein
MSFRLDFEIFKIYTGIMATKQKRRGRPVLGSDQRKSETFVLRMDSAEKAAFTEAADLSGIPLAAWMRERLRVAARIELEGAGRSVAFLNRVNHRAH